MMTTLDIDGLRPTFNGSLGGVSDLHRQDDYTEELVALAEESRQATVESLRKRVHLEVKSFLFNNFNTLQAKYELAKPVNIDDVATVYIQGLLNEMREIVDNALQGTGLIDYNLHAAAFTDRLARALGLDQIEEMDNVA